MYFKMGCPKKYETGHQFERAIERYFNSITTTEVLKDEEGNEILDNNGDIVNKITFVERPTIMSLCRYLGVCKQTFHNYAKQDEFRAAYEFAREVIEDHLEKELYRKEQVNGIIFNLKHNYGWKDKQEIENINTNINQDITMLSEDERKKRIEELIKKAGGENES